jgi:hypothetical protein
VKLLPVSLFIEYPDFLGNIFQIFVIQLVTSEKTENAIFLSRSIVDSDSLTSKENQVSSFPCLFFEQSKGKRLFLSVSTSPRHRTFVPHQLPGTNTAFTGALSVLDTTD